MRVLDRNMREVSYSTSKQVYELDLHHKFIQIDDSDTEKETAEPDNEPELADLKKIHMMNENQTTSSNMDLPSKIADKGLLKKPLNIGQKDDFNRNMYAVLHPDLDFVELCPLFFHHYKTEIGERVVLKDPDGTQFKCILQNVGDSGFLTHGTNNIKKHYNLEHDGWLRFYYAGNDKFVMRVEDRYMREVSYSKTKEVYEIDLEFYDNFIHIDHSEQEHETEHPDNAPEQATFKKILTLTKNQATSNYMNLPAEMVEKALYKRPKHITLKDDSDRIFPCKLNFFSRRPNEGKISTGWKLFCQENNLHKGSKVELSVRPHDQTILFARTKNLH